MSSSESSVIDASALLAYLFGESGGERLLRLAGDLPVMSTVNWSEVVQKALQYAVSADRLRAVGEEAGIVLLPFTPEHADHAARLWSETRSLGLSLADRACLALALVIGAPAVTADRTWTQLAVPGLRVEVLER